MFRDPANYAVILERGKGDDYTVHVYRHDTPDALTSASDVHIAIQKAPKPDNSSPMFPNLVAEPALLGTDVAAFLAGYAALKQSKFSSMDLTAKAVVIQQFVYGGHLRYGLAFVPKWFVRGTIGCDLQTMVDPQTYTSTSISRIC